MQIKTVRAAFWLKPILAFALAGLADLALWMPPAFGSTLGVLAGAILICALIVRPPGRRDVRGWLAVAAAAMLALALFDHPTFLGWLMFAVAIGVAVLSPRTGRADAWAWSQRLVLAGLAGLIAPLLDLVRLRKTRRRRRFRLAFGFAQFVLPILGGVLFISLFAAANPIFADVLQRLQIPELDFNRVAFWCVALIAAWMVLRPRLLKAIFATPGGKEVKFPGVTPASVGLSLVLFNLIFALQNGLDIAFLWSGAPLPGQVTLADYAHKGAYTLIFTAILAGVFVLVAMQPGSQMARSRPLRILVVAWVAQNLLLVASSALRTWDYVEAYSLTRLRIAALIWMALVAVGLVLICWRLLRGKSAAWLINANVAAAGLVLAGCCVVDLGAVAAAWNVRHAKEIDGRGVNLDLGYLTWIGDASLVPLSELLQRPLPPDLRARVEQARWRLLVDLTARQASWRGWIWRGQRRLEAAQALAPRRAPRAASSFGGPQLTRALQQRTWTR